MSYSFLDLSYGGCLAATLAAVAGVMVWWRNQYSTRSGIVISLVIVAFSGVGQFIHDEYDRDRLIINFPAVGQADAAIIRRNGMTILMDCGPQGLPGRDCPVTRSLRRYGISKINAVYLSHLHPDHAGGLREILTLWPVEAIYSPEELGREGLPKLMPEGDVTASRVHILKCGDVVRLWPFSFRVLGPDPAENTGKDMNRGSLQILVEVSDFHALFTGDAGWDQVGRVLNTLPGLDLLKIPHHGSRDGFPPDGLESVFNRLQRGAGFKAVCPSDPPGNRHLPAAEVTDWFAERGIELVYTGVNGVIIRY
jgi:competence protein ComEC